jgi:hypothetical protein
MKAERSPSAKSIATITPAISTSPPTRFKSTPSPTRALL